MYVCVSVSALSMVPQLRPSIVTVNLGISSQTIKWKTVVAAFLIHIQGVAWRKVGCTSDL